MATEVQRFAALFAGLRRAYNTLETYVPKSAPGAKRPVTHHDGVEEANYEWHLRGNYALGVCPVDENGLCNFAAIDIDSDIRSEQHNQLSRLARRFGGILSPSKSVETAHIFFFFSEPIPADHVRRKLEDIRGALGLGANSEIFPKQDHPGGGVGSPITLPMYRSMGNVTDIRPRAFYDDGVERHRLSDYLALAESLRQTRQQFMGLNTEGDQSESSRLFHEGPPCLGAIANQGGVTDGEGRNTFMLNVALYLIRSVSDGDPEDDAWEDQLDEYNRHLVNPPYSRRELDKVIRSAKKQRTYTCNKHPLQGHCQKTACMRRRYGIMHDKRSVNDEVFIATNLVIELYEQRRFWFEINGTKIGPLTAKEIRSYHDVAARAAECGINFQMANTAALKNYWNFMHDELFQNPTYVEPKGHRGPRDQFLAILEQMEAGVINTPYKNPVELVRGSPHPILGEDGHVYFNQNNIMDFCIQRGLRVKPEDATDYLAHAPVEVVRRDSFANFVFRFTRPSPKHSVATDGKVVDIRKLY